MIAEDLAPNPTRSSKLENDLKSLKSLRLASRSLSISEGIKAVLFRSITLKASPKNVRWLEERKDQSRSLAQYVRHVSFEPSRYSWNMSYDAFKNIARAGAVEDYCIDNEIDLDSEELDDYDDFVDQHFNNDSDSDGEPIDLKEVQREYRVYIKRAKRTLRLFNGPRLTEVWTMMLQTFRNATKFYVGYWDYSEDRWDAPCGKPRPGTHTHEVQSLHEAMDCRLIYQSVGERLVKAVLSSLTRAGSTIEHLDLGHIQGWRFDWAFDSTLEGLDLSKLHTLIFRPRCLEYQERQRYDEASLVATSGSALCSLLNKCSKSIRHLNVTPKDEGNWTAAEFPTRWQVPLPKLTHLSISGRIDCKRLAKLVRGSTKLKDLRCDPKPDPDSDLNTLVEWRTVLREVRYHANKLRFRARRIGRLGPLSDCWFDHHTGCEVDSVKAGKWYYPDDYMAMANYLSNKGKWNRYCEGRLRQIYLPGVERNYDTDGDASDEEAAVPNG